MKKEINVKDLQKGIKSLEREMGLMVSQILTLNHDEEGKELLAHLLLEAFSIQEKIKSSNLLLDVATQSIKDG